MSGEPHEHWQFKREISIGDILLAATVAIAIGLPLLTWAFGIEKRLSVLEDRVNANWVQQQRVDTSQDQQLRDSIARIEQSLRDIQSYVMERNGNGVHGR